MSGENNHEASDTVAEEGAGTEDNPILSLDDLKAMVDAENDFMTALYSGSDEKQCSYSRGYLKRQAIFACRDCSSKNKPMEAKQLFSEPAGVCLACAIACHADHDLIELYTKRNFRCDCGNSKLTEVPCRLFPNKDVDNPLNSYNHNFSGLYCTCNKPYPCDPDDSEIDRIGEDEMVQCIVCEDWYHSCHLPLSSEDKALLDVDDQEYEMICNCCSSKYPFLSFYYKYFKTISNEASDKNLRSDAVPTCFLDEIKTKSGIDNPNIDIPVFPPNWRSKLCKCDKCMQMYDEEQVKFITDVQDTLAFYEAAGRAKTIETGGVPIGDRIVSATLSRIPDRVVQTEIAHGYADFKNRLTEFMADVSKRKRVITEDDVNEFFQNMNERKKKRLGDDSSSAGGGSSNSRMDGNDDDDYGGGPSGIGTPPANCHM